MALRRTLIPVDPIHDTRSPALDQLGWREIAQVLAYANVALLWWMFRSTTRRVDVLEREAVRKEEFNKEVETMRADHASMHEENKADRRAAQEETRALLARIESKIDVAAQATLAEQVRMISIELGKLEVYATELKHVHIDSYVREIAVLKTKVDQLERSGK